MEVVAKGAGTEVVEGRLRSSDRENRENRKTRCIALHRTVGSLAGFGR